MLSKPLISGCSEKFYDIALITLVTIMYIGLCAEADIYVPAFPQMIKYFGVAENEIQLILSINFSGLCLAGLVIGPLSDSYGRRPVLLWGLALFAISSLFCLYAEDFRLMLFWRFAQGVGAAVPMVVGCATFMDKYSQEKAGQIIGIINSVISASMAGAPIAGAWISEYLGWRANFTVILILAVISALGTWLFIGETMPQEKRRIFNLSTIIKDYFRILRSLEFMTYSTLAISAFVCIVVYVANLSVIFVNHMHMTLTEFSYWQASTMGTFIIFSLISTKLISAKGINYAQNFGSALALIGVISMFCTAQIDHANVPMICLSMALVAAGGALFGGAYGVKAMSIFPEMNGAATAMMTAIRQLACAGFVALSELGFDGTIVPIARIIFGFGLFAALCYVAVKLKESKIVKAV